HSGTNESLSDVQIAPSNSVLYYGGTGVPFGPMGKTPSPDQWLLKSVTVMVASEPMLPPGPEMPHGSLKYTIPPFRSVTMTEWYAPPCVRSVAMKGPRLSIAPI